MLYIFAKYSSLTAKNSFCKRAFLPIKSSLSFLSSFKMKIVSPGSRQGSIKWLYACTNTTWVFSMGTFIVKCPFVSVCPLMVELLPGTNPPNLASNARLFPFDSG